MQFVSEIAPEMHRNGINVRHLGRLLDSLRESEAGLMTEHELIDPPASETR